MAGDPSMPREVSCVQLLNDCRRRLERPERQVVNDLLDFIKNP
jgi:hypothetical protein